MSTSPPVILNEVKDLMPDRHTSPSAHGDEVLRSAQDDKEIIDKFAIVEIFGHRRLAGRVQEVEQYGTKMLRIDIPKDGDFEKGYVTQLYGGGSLFSVTPCTLEYVQKINRPYERPALMSPPAEGEDDGDDDGPSLYP